MEGVLNPLPRLKRFARMVFRRAQVRVFQLLGTDVDYLAKVGDGTGSSTVAAVINWVARTFPEAPPALWRDLDDGQEEKVRDHPLLRLLQRPNEFYTGIILWMATVTDWMVDGNAYWLKIRDRGGTVRELWWAPHWTMEPKGTEEAFITHYEYRPGGLAGAFHVVPGDVVHFRFGLDSDEPRKGKSQLKSVLREVYTDDEAAAFTAALLRNMGVPGLLVSPKPGVTFTDEQGKETKAVLQSKLAGDKRGEPLVLTGATDVAQFGFNPEQLLLRDLRRIPEERVSAVTGIPAIVVGFGAGLERSTFTNMGEAREAAYEAGLIPTQRIMSEDIRFQLLTDFERDVFALRFGFDLSKVRVLQEDLYRQTQRHAIALREGAEMVAEFRRALDLEVDKDRDEVFLRAANVVTVPASKAGSPVAVPSANGNGNGLAHHGPDEIAAAVLAAIERKELATA